MGEIPLESRVSLPPLFSVVGESRSRFMLSKDSRTLLSRQLHFMEFIKAMKLDNNVALTGFTTLTRNVIMTCYVSHLATGNTLLCKSIKSGIIFKYLSAAADLSKPAQMMNPTIDIMGK